MNAKMLIAKLKQYPLATAGVVISFIFLILLYFSSGKVSDLENTYQDVETELKTIRNNNQQAVGLSEDLEKAQEMVVEIDSRLMNDDAKADHYQYFLGIAETSGVSISDPVYGGYFNPGEKGVSIETSEYAQINYSLDVKGDFDSVMEFIYGLQTGKYFTRENRLKISTLSDSTGSYVRAEMLVKILAIKTEVKKEGGKK